MSELTFPSSSRGVQVSPLAWLIGLAAVLFVGEGVGLLAAAQGADVVAEVVRTIGRFAAIGWLGFGLWHWRQVEWVGRFAFYFIITLFAAVMWTICQAAGWSGVARVIFSAYVLAAAFVVGLMLLRLVLSPGVPALGIARTLLDEAIRMKIAVVFVIALLLFVPALPVIVDSDDFLQYRIQSFLTWSLGMTALLLGLMTIFLAIMSITGEIRSRRIFLTMTKPVGPATYIFGKWLGIVLLNLLLVVIFGGGIYAFVTQLAAEKNQMPPNHPQRVAVEERVLVARQAVSPQLPGELTWQELIEERIKALRAESPTEYRTIDNPTRDNIYEELRREWYRLGPRMARAYQFSGLSVAKENNQSVQLRLTPRIGGETYDGKVQLAVRVNGRDINVSRMSGSTTHVTNIPTWLIDDDGVIVMQLANPSMAMSGGNGAAQPVDQPTVSFDPDDGIQLLYPVGPFAPNLARAMLIIWVSTAFLAMISLAAGTYLSFPVACVFALMVYVASIGSSFITESFRYYAANPPRDADTWQTITWFIATFFEKLGSGEIWEATKMLVRLLGQGFLLLIPSFAKYNPIALINDGQVVSWPMVAGAVLMVGVVATGLVGVIAWWLFKRKELAQVVV